MTLMWPQQIQTIKRQREFLEPLVYLSSLSANKANNPKKAREQARRVFSKFGEPHGVASGNGVHSLAWLTLNHMSSGSLLHRPELRCLIGEIEKGIKDLIQVTHLSEWLTDSISGGHHNRLNWRRIPIQSPTIHVTKAWSQFSYMKKWEESFLPHRTIVRTELNDERKKSPSVGLAHSRCSISVSCPIPYPLLECKAASPLPRPLPNNMSSSPLNSETKFPHTREKNVLGALASPSLMNPILFRNQAGVREDGPACFPGNDPPLV